MTDQQKELLEAAKEALTEMQAANLLVVVKKEEGVQEPLVLQTIPRLESAIKAISK